MDDAWNSHCTGSRLSQAGVTGVRGIACRRLFPRRSAVLREAWWWEHTLARTNTGKQELGFSKAADTSWERTGGTQELLNGSLYLDAFSRLTVNSVVKYFHVFSAIKLLYILHICDVYWYKTRLSTLKPVVVIEPSHHSPGLLNYLVILLLLL